MGGFNDSDYGIWPSGGLVCYGQRDGIWIFVYFTLALALILASDMLSNA